MKSIYDNVNATPNPYGSVNIDLDVTLNKIKDFDMNQNSFIVSGTMNVIWCDSRRKFDKRLGQYKLYNDDVAVKALEYGLFWTPEVRFINSTAKRKVDNIRLYEYYDGSVVYRENFVVTLVSKFNYTKMPFDTQKMVIELGSMSWDFDYVRILPEDKTVFFADDFQMIEFSQGETSQEIYLYTNPEDGKQYSYLKATFEIKRYYSIYFFKLTIPITLIVFITSLTFLIDNEEIHARIDIYTGSIIAAVVYLIITEDWLPRYHFWNFMNTSILASVALIMYGAFLSLTLKTLHDNGYVQCANKAALWMILYYNLLYLFILLDLFIYYVVGSILGCVCSFTWTIAGLSYILHECTNLEMIDTKK